ncbi:MAG: GspH/FimT family pseudopilin [Rhodocyclaceae bacterium]|nr:GspH/FimT family pseudopilin [Rhodocyclaceae bacterium]
MGQRRDLLDRAQGRLMLSHRGAPGMRGITLIETMITITILGILVALAMPAIGDWLLNTRLRNAAESIQNGLQMARNEAVRCNVPVEFMLDPAYDSSWTIQAAYPALPTPCRDAIPQWPIIQSRPAEEGSKNALLDPTPANATTVTFDGLGRRVAANADASAVMTRICVDLETAVLDATRTRDLELNIESGGGVRMCDPKVSDVNDTRFCPSRAASSCTGR